MTAASRRRLLLLAACLLSAIGGPATAQGNTQGNTGAALLIALPGWEGGETNTVSLDQGSASYRWASREYQRGEARITPILGTQPGAAALDASMGQDMEMRSGSTLVRSRVVRGVRVVTSYNDEDKNGAILVMLTPGGAGGSFVFQFEGLALEEASRICEGFDWAAMQRQASAK